ncbi:MAG: response regulator transcription factor [Ruminococcus sp.]|nr:response regulator transcription factor [Ruminococcus sp.]
MTDILVVEDNIEMGSILCDFLQNEGYSTHHCTTGEDALNYFKNCGARLLVLDVMLPGLDGLAVCKEIRETSNSPIIIVSAKTEKDDKLGGLILGADDYIEKPYDIDILLAKISGIFKRRFSDKNTVKDGEIILDKTAHTVSKNGIPIKMTVKEFELLTLLIENPDKTLSKEMLFNKIWGTESFSEQQTLTVHIKWLRQKIEENPKKPQHILTVWGVGYKYQRSAK